MRILLPLGRNWTPATVALATRLSAEGHEIYAITHYLRWVDEAVRLGFPRERIFYVNEDHRRRMDREEPDQSALSSLEDRYGLPTLWPYVVADRHVAGFSHEDLMRLIQVESRSIESFLDRTALDGIVLDAVDRFGLLFLYHAAATRGIPVRIFAASRIPGKFHVVDNPYDSWPVVEKAFERIKAGAPSEEQLAEAAAFLDRFTRNRTQPRYMSAYKKPGVVSALTQGWWYVRNYYSREGRNEYSSTSPQRLAAKELRRIAAWRLLAGRDPRFEMPHPGEAFAFFPLHLYPESSVMVLAPHVIDQIEVIAQVARSLPFAMKLYVKEHVASIGTRPPGFYRRIKTIPNVRLISPMVHSHDLIRDSSLVTVISSTVGWEALLYERPVLTFGRVFYNAFDLVHRAGPPAELAQQIMSILRSWEPDRELLLRYLVAILNTSDEGELDPAQPDFLSSENLDRISERILREFSES